MTFARIRAHRATLWAEFIGLFGVVPLLVAVFLPPQAMLPVLFAFTLLGVWLLQRTPGFDWTDLRGGWDQVRLVPVVGFAAVTAVVSLGVIHVAAPDAAFGLMRHRPWLLAMILLIYPMLSALPQEVIFRPLFFRRYGKLMPGGAMLWINASVFSFAHLMYWNAVVAVMTFFGGLVFGWAYLRRGSFPLAVVMHVVAGWVLFSAGLGIYFYSGNVQRPF